MKNNPSYNIHGPLTQTVASSIAFHTSRFLPILRNQNPSTLAMLLPPSRASASFLKTSALNFLKAASILALLSGSFDRVRLAEKPPVRMPVSPPKRRPPAPKKRYVVISPRVVGLRIGSSSAVGIASTSDSHSSACNSTHTSSDLFVGRTLTHMIPW